MNRLVMFLLVVIVAASCAEVSNNRKLRVYGNPQIVESVIDGETVYDTVPHTIQYFRFLNQDSAVVTPETLEGKIYVADFFFTSCPTICPVMKKQMLRVYNQFEQEDQFMILSHSIDPEYDTVALLHDFAERLGVRSDKWMFLTGDKDEIYDLAEGSYMVVAAEEGSAPGGYIHSGAFLLVDTKKRIRGVYDGTVPEQVDILMKDIERLIEETNRETEAI